MKLPENTVIAREKLTNYLLIQKKRNDKSKWLAGAGYTSENWQVLEADLKNHILSEDAVPVERTEFGQMYEIRGRLTGPNGKNLTVLTVWMTDSETGITRFITMYPDKKVR
ncbi:MAG: hypothetical protein GY749_20415 [Desulfobacteraceae bacterium]|nr:hypothetical protein [Desulfobacteraceae bacterium]